MAKDDKISDYDDAPGGNYRAGLVSELAGAEAKVAVAKAAGDADAQAAAEANVKDVQAELQRVGVTGAQIEAHRAETRA